MYLVLQVILEVKTSVCLRGSGRGNPGMGLGMSGGEEEKGEDREGGRGVSEEEWVEKEGGMRGGGEEREWVEGE